jgi:hypothetical protein
MVKFTGTLFKIGKPSQHGVEIVRSDTHGIIFYKKVIVDKVLVKELKKKAIGKPIWLAGKEKAHDRKNVIGRIDKVRIMNQEFIVSGEIIENKDKEIRSYCPDSLLGLSYDIVDLYTPDINPDTIIVSSGKFLGATIIVRNRAAHGMDCSFELKET